MGFRTTNLPHPGAPTLINTTLPTELHVDIFVYRTPPPTPPAAYYTDPVDENDEIYDMAEQIQQQQKQKVQIK